MKKISEKKKLLRAEMVLKRDQLDVEKKRLADRFFFDELVKICSDAQVIHVYLPIRSEPNLYPFIEYLLKEGKTVIAPETLRDHKMVHRPLKEIGAVRSGLFGTKYPDTDEIYQGNIDVIVVPGLAFNKSGRRLGYGGGYYDGFLKHHTEAFKVALAYDFQYIDTVPYVAHDSTVDKVVCFEG